MNPEDLFRKIFEEFSGSGAHSQSYQDYRDYAPLEVCFKYPAFCKCVEMRVVGLALLI